MTIECDAKCLAEELVLKIKADGANTPDEIKQSIMEWYRNKLHWMYHIEADPITKSVTVVVPQLEHYVDVVIDID